LSLLARFEADVRDLCGEMEMDALSGSRRRSTWR